MSSKQQKSSGSSKSKHSTSSPKHKSKPSHSSSSRHQKYKSKYQTRRSKERKEKHHSPPPSRATLQALLHEDSKKCRVPAKRNVRFEDDKKLVILKFFSIADEPIAQALTEEQVASIRKKLSEQISSILPALCSSEELKHKESLMEGLRRRQNEKETESKLVEMKPAINWFQPIEFNVEEKYGWGEDSTEIEVHDKRMSTKLRCFYPTTDHIPSEPNFVIINNKYSVKQVQQIQLYTFTSQDAIQDFDKQQISKQEAVEVLVKHSINLKQPKKGILKKSREQLLKEKEEEEKKQQFIKEQQKKEKEMLKEKKKKEKIAKENAKKLAPETLKKLMAVLQSSGAPTPEQAEELKQILKSIHDQGIDTQSIIQHIKLLKETLLKSSKKIRKDHIKAPYQQGAQQQQQQQQQQYPQQHQQLQQKFQLINQSLILFFIIFFNYFYFQDFSNKSKFFRNKKLQLFAQKKFMIQQTPLPNFINPTQLQQPKFPPQINLPAEQNQQQPQQTPLPPVQIIDPKKLIEDKKIEDPQSKSPSLPPQQQPEISSIELQQQGQQVQQQQQQQQQQFQSFQQFPIQQNQFPKTFPKYRNNLNIPPQQQLNPPQQQLNPPNFIQPPQYQPNQPNQFPPMQQQQQQRPFNKNYKRVPCTKFHSPQGCTFGDRCNFIHDYNYAGVPSPNMYKYVNQKQLKQMTFSPQDQMTEQLQQPQQQLVQNHNFIPKNQQFQQQQPQFGSQQQEQFPQFQQQQQQQFNNYNQQFPQKINNMQFNQRFNGMNHFKNQYQNINMQNMQNIQKPEFNDMNLNDNEQMQEE